jgi:transketolase
MALEDLAMCRAEPNFTVLYPCDAVSTERLSRSRRTSRDRSTCGSAARRRRSSTQRRDVHDRRLESAAREPRRCGDGDCGAGDGVDSARGAQQAEGDRASIRVIDLYSVAPVDRDGLLAAARATKGRLITVEDHYAAGGVGDAVAEAVADGGFTVTVLQSARSRDRESPKNCSTASAFRHRTSSMR